MKKINFFILCLILINLLSIIIFADDGNLFGKSSYDGRVNNFLSSSSNKLSMLLPAIMLVIVIITALIDFGAVGISIGSIGSLFILYLFKIVYINPVSLISFMLMIFILIYKMQD